MIDLHRVRKQFAGKRQVTALEDVTLTIRGEMVSSSVLGPGKSTRCNLVGGLDRATSGGCASTAGPGRPL
jgi:ABC-type nitrate/sulfonate/bicarbonate transport system ATPase subunit